MNLRNQHARAGAVVLTVCLVVAGAATAATRRPQRHKGSDEDAPLPDPTPVKEAAATPSPELLAAEGALRDEMAAQYREAVHKYGQRDYSAAYKGFLACYSLWQQALPQLTQPAKLETLRKDCERYMNLCRAAIEEESRRGSVKDVAARLKLERFSVRDAEASAALELLRGKIGTLGGCAPPSFVMKVPAEVLARKVTLDVGGISLLHVLEMVCDMAGVQMQFERYSVVFVEQERVTKVIQ